MRTESCKAEGAKCRVVLREVRGNISFEGLSEYFSRLEGCSIIGGNEAVERCEGYSYWMAEPREVFSFKRVGGEAFAGLQKAICKYRIDEEDKGRGFFCGGWVGYFGYELGRCIEKLEVTTVDDLGMDLIRLGFYDRVICYDHGREVFLLIALEIEDEVEAVEEKLEGLLEWMEASGDIEVDKVDEVRGGEMSLEQFGVNMGRDEYLAAVAKIKRYIYEGDCYQVNFSQRFCADFGREAVCLFHWQNRVNPCGYAGYIDTGDCKIVSASPELFLRVRDGVISTRPIKGTRRRYVGEGNIELNERNRRELEECEKERAELNMIIDLERNDITRVCEYGTIRVSEPRSIEEHPTVFHAVATVEGKLREDAGFCDILRATFPGGSITGAPKVRSMEIIDETEPTERGVYTGSIGFIGIDGDVCLNIAIRTIIIKEAKAYVQVGGGIVADSEAEREWEECIDKARVLLAGIAALQRKDDRG